LLKFPELEAGTTQKAKTNEKENELQGGARTENREKGKESRDIIARVTNEPVSILQHISHCLINMFSTKLLAQKYCCDDHSC